MTTKHCPACDLEMEHIEDDPDVGVAGHWYCEHCHVVIDDFDDYDESDLYATVINRNG